MKKLFALLLAIVMLFALTSPAFAADDEATAAANALHDLGLFKGTGTNEDGTPNYDLDRTMNRTEAVTMLVRLLGKEEEAKAGTWVIPFTDVADWAVPYVGYAYANGLTKGTGETTFGGSDLVSATQYLTFVLRALGYDSSTDFQWDKAWELTDQLGITSGQYNTSSEFKRANVVTISEKALFAKKKNSEVSLIDMLVAAGAVSAQAAESLKDALGNQLKDAIILENLYAKIDGEYYSLPFSDNTFLATMANGKDYLFVGLGELAVLSLLSGDYKIINDSDNPFIAGSITYNVYPYVESNSWAIPAEEVEIDGHVVSLYDYGTYRAGSFGPIYTSMSSADYLRVVKLGNTIFSIYHSDYKDCKEFHLGFGSVADGDLLVKQGVKLARVNGLYYFCVEDLANYLGIEISDYSISQLETGEYIISLR